MKKVALVTGGTRGIGRATAIELSKKGYITVISYSKSETEAKYLSDKYNIIPFQADFREKDTPYKLIENVTKELGQIDLLVNNAGISIINIFQCLTDKEIKDIYNVNLFGTIETTRAVISQMISRHSGCIVNVSSIWGEVGASCEVDYSVTKGAVIAFTKALAKEAGPSGIRVNCVSPGVIDTDMNLHLSEGDMKELAEETPLCRIGRAEEVAKTICYLASDDASFITGQVISVNGGTS